MGTRRMKFGDMGRCDEARELARHRAGAPARALAYKIMALGLLLALPRAAAADRPGPVLEQKILLEQALTGVINQALEPIAGGRRLYAIVAVSLSGKRVTLAKEEEGSAMSFTMGKVSSASELKLPGLPTLQRGLGKVSQPVKIRLEPKGRRSVSSALHTNVEKVWVRLYADPQVPAQVLQDAERLAVDLASLDKSQGDVVQVIKLAPLPPAPAEELRTPWVGVAYTGLGVFAGSLLLAALLLSLGLARGRSGAGAAARLDLRETRAGEAREGLGADGEEEEASGEALAAQPGAGPGRFAGLAQASDDELGALLQELQDGEASTVFALGGIPRRSLRGVLEHLGSKRQLAIAVQLGYRKKVAAEKVAALEAQVDELLHRVRNPSELEVGGPGHLAELLTWTSRATTRKVLEALGKSDAELAEQTRQALTQFEDLAELAPAKRRRLLSSLDMSVLARALVGGSPALVEAVQGVLSKRQQRMLAEEQRGLGELDEGAAERAREQVQQQMAALGVK